MLFSSLFPLRPFGALVVTVVLSTLVGSAWSALPADAIRQALQSGQLEQAAKLVQQEKQNSPRDVQIRFLEGVVQAQQGQTDKAIESFRKLIESNPEVVEAHNNLGVLYASKGRLEDARKALEAGMHANASYAALHRNLGDVQSQLTKQTYAKALQVDSKTRPPSPQLSLLGSMESNASGVPARSAAPVTLVAAATPPTQPAPPSLAPTAPPTPAPKAEPPAVAPAAPAVASAPVPAVKPAPEKPEPKPAQASKPERSDSADTDAIRNAVMTWAKAWSRKDMDNYLEAYASSFVPPDRMARSKWESERRLRILSKKSISVEVKQLKIAVDGKTATAQFQQIYSSDNFTGNSRKTLEMVKQGSRWLIARETVN